MRRNRLLAATCLPALLLFCQPKAKAAEQEIKDSQISPTLSEIFIGNSKNPYSKEIDAITEKISDAKNPEEEYKSAQQIFKLRDKIIGSALKADDTNKGIYYTQNEADIKRHANPIARGTVSLTHMFKKGMGWIGSAANTILSFPGKVVRTATDAASDQIEKVDNVVPYVGTSLSFPFRTAGLATYYATKSLADTTDNVVTLAGSLSANVVNTTALLATGEFSYVKGATFNTAENMAFLSLDAADIAVNIATHGALRAVEVGCRSASELPIWNKSEEKTEVQKTKDNDNTISPEQTQTAAHLKEIMEQSSLKNNNNVQQDKKKPSDLSAYMSNIKNYFNTK